MRFNKYSSLHIPYDVFVFEANGRAPSGKCNARQTYRLILNQAEEVQRQRSGSPQTEGHHRSPTSPGCRTRPPQKLRLKIKKNKILQILNTCTRLYQSKLDLVDIWRTKYPDTKSQKSPWSQKSPRIFCRLDYWLISNNLSDFVKSTEIASAIRTDHDAISLEFGELENERKGPGFWKMNVSLLDDEEYINNVTEMIPIWITEGRKELSDDRNVWDSIKYNVRANAVYYSQRKANGRNGKEIDLQNEPSETKRAFENNPSDSNANYYNAAREKLETFFEDVIVRSRGRWHEHGEKSTLKNTYESYS